MPDNLRDRIAAKQLAHNDLCKCGHRAQGERRQIRRANNVIDRADEEHGTDAAAKRHERRGEVPCFACRHAAAEAGRRRRQERP